MKPSTLRDPDLDTTDHANAGGLSRRWMLALPGLPLMAACRARGSVLPPCRGAVEYQGAPRTDAPGRVFDGRMTGAIDGSVDAATAAALDAALTEILAAAKVPAVSAAVAIPGQGTWARQVGVADVRARSPIGEAVRFQAASIGKLVTAILVHRLVEAGALDLQGTVDKWFPEFPESESITIDHLLRHTSGAYSFDVGAEDALDNLRWRAPDALIQESASHAPLFCPGATWSYCNVGYVMLGRIVEMVRGESLAQVVAREVVGPLGLVNTAVNVKGGGASGVVRGHHGGVPVEDIVDYATPFAAGGISSTAADLVRVVHALLAGRLVREATVRSMLTAMAPMFDDPELRYGAGIMMYTGAGPGLMIGHSGGARGCRAIAAYMVEDGVYVAVLFNDEQPAEAGLWRLAQALRRHRGAKTRA